MSSSPHLSVDLESTRKPLRIFLFSHPRTASHLLMRLLENYPNLEQSIYPFIHAHTIGPEKQFAKNTVPPGVEIPDEYNLSFQQAMDQMEKIIANSEKEGKIPMIKDHCYHLISSRTVSKNLPYERPVFDEPIINDKKLDVVHSSTSSLDKITFIDNPTLLPDRFLSTLTPIFTIRHPVRQVASFMKASRPDITMKASAFDVDFPMLIIFKWTRLIFDAYLKTFNTIPVVIDGDDLITDTENKMRKVCDHLGLDHAQIKYEWESRECPPWGEGIKLFMEKARKSTGVIKDDTLSSAPNLEEESDQWRKLWGEDEANRMTDLVKATMEDYNYLKKFSV